MTTDQAPFGSLALWMQEPAPQDGTIDTVVVQPSDGVLADGSALETLLPAEGLPALLRAVVILLVGLPLVLAVARGLGRWVQKRYSAQQAMVAEKLFFYAGIAVVLVTFLGEMGFGLGPLLGAAGIVGIALGFASQTSVSNIISGFFLMAEQPFRVDDVIRVGTTVGQVLSVDMMSVKLRTFDNEFVRIPNESLIQTEVTTLTRFPIRRVDVPVGVAYKEDVERVRLILLELAEAHPLCLIEPAPMIRFERFGASSIDLTLAVWATRENRLQLKNEIQEAIKERLDADEIEIPFPHQTLYVGAGTEPFPVRLLDSDSEKLQSRERNRAVSDAESAGPVAATPDEGDAGAVDPATDD